MDISSLIYKLSPAPLKRLIKRTYTLSWAIVDPKWFGFLNLMFENAYIQEKFRYMFFSDEENPVLIDCGANVWLIIDIWRFLDYEVYAFEPNPQAIKLLNHKYINDKKVHLYPDAVSNKNWVMNFFVSDNSLYDVAGSIYENWWMNKQKHDYEVNVVRLVDTIKNDILTKHKSIHLLKLDIEWAEFDVINDIIDAWLCKDIKYIVVETHERFFGNWKQMLKELKKKIVDNNIDNIFLDWF